MNKTRLHDWNQRVLVVALVISLSAAPTYSQRRSRPSPPPDISSGFSALGILPEEIRSILLIFAGRNLSKADAEKLEVEVRKKPDNVDNRLKLIGYYDRNGRTSLDHLHLREHVLWMVENHPEHPA